MRVHLLTSDGEIIGRMRDPREERIRNYHELAAAINWCCRHGDEDKLLDLRLQQQALHLH